MVKIAAEDLEAIEGDNPISDVLSVNFGGLTESGETEVVNVSDAKEPITLMLPVKMIEGVDLTDPKNLSAKFVMLPLNEFLD